MLFLSHFVKQLKLVKYPKIGTISISKRRFGYKTNLLYRTFALNLFFCQSFFAGQFTGFIARLKSAGVYPFAFDNVHFQLDFF